jgi:ketosteroid isomerase-like protein
MSPLLLLFLLGVCAASGKDDVKKTLENSDQGFTKAVNSKDVEGIMKYYWNSPDLIAFYPDSEYKGYDAVKKSWEDFFKNAAEVHLTITDSHVKIVNNSTAYDWGHFEFSVRSLNPPDTMKAKGRFLEIWEKKEGKWVLTVDHASSPMPPPPPTSAMDSTKIR